MDANDVICKAKTKANDEWVTGVYIPLDMKRSEEEDACPSIRTLSQNSRGGGEIYEIDILSVCRISPFTDKNGTPVFEYDILKDKDGSYWTMKRTYKKIATNQELVWEIQQSEQVIKDGVRSVIFHAIPVKGDLKNFEVIANLLD